MKDTTITRGFATSKEQAQDLAKFGVSAACIYRAGSGAETLETCIDSFRGRPGRLIVAHDLRVFGSTKKQVAAVMTALEIGKIHVTDILHPEDVTVAQMVQRAQQAISSHNFKDRRAAKRQGARGGLGKGVSAAIIRDSHSPKWLIDRIVDCCDIPWSLKLELLQPHFNQSTLRRHYGARASAQRS